MNGELTLRGIGQLDLSVATGDDRALTQQNVRTLRLQADAEVLAYTSRHGDDITCYAVFEAGSAGGAPIAELHTAGVDLDSHDDPLSAPSSSTTCPATVMLPRLSGLDKGAALRLADRRPRGRQREGHAAPARGPLRGGDHHLLQLRLRRRRRRSPAGAAILAGVLVHGGQLLMALTNRDRVAALEVHGPLDDLDRLAREDAVSDWARGLRHVTYSCDEIAKTVVLRPFTPPASSWPCSTAGFEQVTATGGLDHQPLSPETGLCPHARRPPTG